MAQDMSDPLAEVASTSEKMISDTLARLRSQEKVPLPTLLFIRQYLSWKDLEVPSEVYELLGHRMLQGGAPLMAYDVVAKGIEADSHNVRLRQLMALALARSGATRKANEMLRALEADKHADAETIGLLARTHKDLWSQTTTAEERKAELLQANRLYLRAYESALAAGDEHGAIYNGVNASSTALLLGRREDARQMAARVREACEKKLRKGDDYWSLATLGEAAVILGLDSEAEKWYRRATDVGKGNYGDLFSTRQNARLLAAFLHDDASRYDKFFGMPKVLVGVTEAATGCGRLGGQLSAEQAAALRKRIGALVAQQGECFAYSAVTAEPDILFLEEVAAHGGGTNVILPFPVSEFRKRKAEFFPDDASRRRFERIVGAAARVVVAGEHRVSSNRVALEYTARMRNGLARLAARMLDAKIVPIVVGDPKQPRRAGPVSQTAGYWTASGVKPEMVELAGPDGGATAEEPMPPGFSQEIMAMLFGDVRGYSQLTEEQIPSFSEHFMGAVARTAATLKRAPVVKNSWGDALYFVFERVGDAAAFALNLFDAIAGVQWEKKGLPDDLTMRMALHAGPVYACRDPVTQTKNCVGWHVNRVARIEPVTPPGQVYASEAFAALAADEGVQGFACDYVGETALAKGFGVFPTYHVRRV